MLAAVLGVASSAPAAEGSTTWALGRSAMRQACARAHAAPARRVAVPRGSVVTQWIRRTTSTVATDSVNPPRAARALALVSVAMNDAAAAARTCGLSGPETRAAVAQAGATTFSFLFPRHATRLSGRRTLARSAAVGSFAAARVVMLARHDGSRGVWHGQPPAGLGHWVPTPPAYAPPLEPLVSHWRPWNLRRASAFRPPPPPIYGTRAFQAQVNRVYETSHTLTARKRRIARFWADGIGTRTPAGHWNAIATTLVKRRRLGTVAAARVFATLNTAEEDAFITCWDAKYHYWLVRPVTVIRRFDPNWSTLLPTPPFPSYVSGHATISAASATVLAHFFPHRASKLRSLAREAAMSRLYAGIHYSMDNNQGLVLGRRVALRAVRRIR